MNNKFTDHYHQALESLKAEGLYKLERIINSPQNSTVNLEDSQMAYTASQAINLCANNYLGLANSPVLIKSAKTALDRYGYGMASVRFICGTQSPHRHLEAKVSQFLAKEDTLLYISCFDANAGLFEALLNEQDAIISDGLNHASIIDGIRLCKAKRLRYTNNNMSELEAHLKATQDCRFRMIATDGVFSMDGIVANLPDICDLAEKYQALVMVDDSHSLGILGKNGRGTPEYYGLEDQVDIVTGTFGKALGGACGGFTSGKKCIIDWLRQKSRPYLFSNSIPPMIAEATSRALDIIREQPQDREQLSTNTRLMRDGLSNMGYTLKPGDHPIIPIMVGDAAQTIRFQEQLLQEGIYVVGFSYPVVPKKQARIRLQVSSTLDKNQLQTALNAFEKVGKQLAIIN